MMISKCKNISYRGEQNASQSSPDSNKKTGILNAFETHIRNTADMNDTVQVPRTVFKGYLAFMVSTTMVALASFAKDKSKFLPKATNFTAALIALWGSYSFVKPYVIRSSKNETQVK